MRQGRGAAGAVDDARLRAAQADPAHWPSHGRTYDEARFSPLAQIDTSNVGRLGLLWSWETGTRRGIEATPLAVDGVLYTTGPWSVVWALDARTGELLWTFDPEVPRSTARIACCDVVNRGVAVYRGRVYVGTLDGRLAALEAATGRPVWIVPTVDPDLPYTITGAPRVVEGKVVIGNGGADFGVRGYVSAYDAATGALVWRTWTVPGDPALGFESKALEHAASTWSGEWWKLGGGGTVWDSMAYDPELRLLYVGTGNGSPWNQALRSPGGGDNLFLSSILALRPDDGELVWYYQTTPGEAWDFTATQSIILADLVIDGRARRVLLQAPKNGFFYVIDRATGELVSAEPFVGVTWASGVDPETGRPDVDPEARYLEDFSLQKPGPFGAHNWHPMSFSPITGLVYLPAQEIHAAYERDPDWAPRRNAWNTGSDPGLMRALNRHRSQGVLLAWDPVRQRAAWRVPHDAAWNGGTLTTAGNLVFQGTADGRFVAYRANDGEKLWEAPAGTGIVAGPITYEVDGRQLVTVMAGWGGILPLLGGDAAAEARVRSVGRVLTFALDGLAELPPAAPLPTLPPPPSFALEASEEDRSEGGALYHRWCAHCHGVNAIGGGVVADLRFASTEAHERFDQIVLGGVRQGDGMPGFADHLDAQQVRRIQAYVLEQAWLPHQAPPESARNR
jgi:quinohemoprotein ethanol dehydrogenase